MDLKRQQKKNGETKNTLQFIEDHLLPNTCFRTQVKEAIDIVCRFLKESASRDADPVRVSKVVEGESGTGRSDADLVVFLTKLKVLRSASAPREFIQEIRRQLEACQREQKFKVTFEVQSPRRENPVPQLRAQLPQLQQEVEFDVLPWTPGYKPNPEIYVQLIQECKSLGKEGEFSTCFTELHLIRLVKHWYQTCKKTHGNKLPPQYALELLTVYAWEQGSGKTDFSTAQGFQTVLELVLKHQKLCIFWEAYYDFKNPVIGRYLTSNSRNPGTLSPPVILDPADPTGNVGGGDTYSWQQLVEGALIWLNYPCFLKWNRSPVGSWNVSSSLFPPQE
uniref:2'-5'-oligoadenylate synthetase 1 n=1 Tax=Sus scrofa TaxID=9823 RepID=A0A5G2QIL7_PIG